MSRKVFTAGEVLAAADVNSFLMDQTVMSFAGTAARGSAIPSPVEGMYTHLEDTDSLQFWNGSSWLSPFGLTQIKKQTIGNAVSSVTVTNAFSSSFTNYKIMISGGVGSISTVNLGLRLGSTTTGYNMGVVSIFYTDGSLYGERTNNGSSFAQAGSSNTNNITMDLTVFNPFIAKQTAVTGGFMGSSVGGVTSGFQNSTTSFTDFTITPASGTLTGGTIYVYGYGDI